MQTPAPQDPVPTDQSEPPMPLPLMTLLRPTPRTLRVGVLLVMVLGPFAARAEDKSAV